MEKSDNNEIGSSRLQKVIRVAAATSHVLKDRLAYDLSVINVNWGYDLSHRQLEAYNRGRGVSFEEALQTQQQAEPLG